MSSPRPVDTEAAISREDIWTRIEDHLRNLSNAIQDEIRNYPTPIAGCDQQFNHLLEKRDRIVSEARRIDQAISQGNLRLASDIVRMSENFGEAVKASMIDHGGDRLSGD